MRSARIQSTRWGGVGARPGRAPFPSGLTTSPFDPRRTLARTELLSEFGAGEMRHGRDAADPMVGQHPGRAPLDSMVWG